MPVISNPSNPTGHTRAGAELEELMAMAEQDKNGILLDEAYEWFHTGSVSGIQYVKDLNNSNVFITGACTKGKLRLFMFCDVVWCGLWWHWFACCQNKSCLAAACFSLQTRETIS